MTLPSINCEHMAESESARAVSSCAMRPVRMRTLLAPASTPVSTAASRQAHRM